MPDIINADLICDVGANYLGFEEQSSQTFYGYKQMLTQNTSDFASYYMKAEKAVVEVIDKLYANIMAAENQ
ncbi:MAG: hypothetical protein MJ175_08400 [Clostridia bacterium]|nr:hypothetical protein [Clostridia bacterium]